MRFSNDEPAGGIATEAERTLARYDARTRMWAVIAAWMDGHISEGQATKLCNISAVDLRECADEYRVVADELWKRFRRNGATIHTDIREEMFQSSVHSCRCSD